MEKISIITVVRNDVKNIERTVLSVLNQKYDGEIEYIVIDGNSNDGTLDILAKYKSQIHCLISEPDRGVYDAMNKGVRNSTGDYVNFMNSGDVFHSDDVLAKMDFSSAGDFPSILYGNVSTRYWDGVYVEKPSEFFKTSLKFKGIGICHQTMFFHGDTIRNMEYDLSYRIASDYDLAYRMYRAGVKFFYRDVIVADYEWGNGISSNPLGLIAVYKENAKVVGQQLHPLFWCKLLLEYYRYIKKKYLSK